ncbi:MAG: Asp-tRNA(Asn)/Glu-tRNA(Gln) amidotransferase subunit GatC [Holosporaceae bacterium]|jgi:aspartyl-tRNA(Asn)/glutamyl-tRNA(Gln) amidotransferase subunit C|nr:Asp-tRNA(Asn)/Glu-tRNA(Gln) amidotransferase subunit GatC [Holosporaceae bacterium]
MSVTESDVRKISYLARIRVDDSKIHEVQDSLNRILSFVEQLNEIDCSQVEDVFHYSTRLQEREDVVNVCDHALEHNAPAMECNMFVVPKVVG